MRVENGKNVLKRCLITGGCGRLGRELARRLTRRDCMVRVLDVRNPSSSVDGVEYLEGDVREPEHALAACAGADTVFHLAAAPPGEDAAFITGVNVDGTAAMLEAAAISGAETFVFASCCSVYGYPPERLPCTEDTPLFSCGPFSLSKVVGEEMCFEALEKTGMRVSVIRAPQALGPGYDDYMFRNWIVDRARSNLPVFLPGGGKRYRHYVDVGDCARAFILAAEKEESLGQCFNVAYTRPCTDEALARAVIRSARSFSITLSVPQPVVELGLRIIRSSGAEPFSSPEARDAFFSEYHYDTSLARQLLGWKPEKTMPVSIHEYMKWLRRKQLRE